MKITLSGLELTQISVRDLGLLARIISRDSGIRNVISGSLVEENHPHSDTVDMVAIFDSYFWTGRKT